MASGAGVGWSARQYPGWGIRPAQVPREYRSRLAHEGFVEIAVGFLGGHRYATGSQVAGVESGRVQLNVAGDELLRK